MKDAPGMNRGASWLRGSNASETRLAVRSPAKKSARHRDVVRRYREELREHILTRAYCGRDDRWDVSIAPGWIRAPLNSDIGAVKSFSRRWIHVDVDETAPGQLSAIQGPVVGHWRLSRSSSGEESFPK